ncbi:DUF5667 domain-containing protein [Paenibacillus sp. MBLB4367]|uniref:DUF5667 domain-containing protein n=1 Tax=Paenibacillus sp. MBLB4367 TaxID=3384767 RepID=UPI0039080FBE
MKNVQMTKLLSKSIVTAMFLTTLGTGTAFASEDPVAAPVAQVIEADSPDLLPGDILYFVKKTYESIQLALTVNDIKEARLLAGFAQERISEAQALMTKGKDELAAKTLQKALDTQNRSIVKVEIATGDKGTAAAATAAPTVSPTPVDATAPSAQPASTATPLAEPSQMPTPTPTIVPSDDENEAELAKKVKNPEQVLKVKTDLQHNIVALTAVLEKVQNPKAQMALLKNIEKSFAHLEKKLSKLEKKIDSSESGPSETPPVKSEEKETTPAPTSGSGEKTVGNAEEVSSPAPDLEQEKEEVVKTSAKEKHHDKDAAEKSRKEHSPKNEKQVDKSQDHGNGNGKDKH